MRPADDPRWALAASRAGATGARLSPMEASDARLRFTVETDRRRIRAGERPVYHATWTTLADGAVDVTVSELPIIHLFVPDHGRIGDGARLLIARTLSVDPDAFDVVLDKPPDSN